jgi:integrase
MANKSNKKSGRESEKRKKKRAPNGSVSTQELKGRRRLKYTVKGETFYMTLPPKGVLSKYKEKKVIRIIELDVRFGRHDNSQKKYLDAILQSELYEDDTAPVGYFNLENELVEWCGRAGRDIGKSFYRAARMMLRRWGKAVTIESIPQRLATEKYGAKTYNDRKGLLNKLCESLRNNGRIKMNPILDMPRARKTHGKIPRHQALSDQEVSLVLEAVRTDQFRNPQSIKYSHNHYYPFLLFITHTGARPAEAIGLQVKKVNFNTRTIVIDQALARSLTSTHPKARKMKSTKMDDRRDLFYEPGSELERVLVEQCKSKTPDDLVFQSPTGLSINERSVNRIVLAPVFSGLGIERRVLYAFRHSFITRCIRLGFDIKTIQAMSGHRDASVLLNVYAEVNQRQVALPSLMK